MLQSELSLIQVCIAQHSESRRNLVLAEEAGSRGDLERGCLHRALAFGQKIHADKARLTLEGLGQSLSSDGDMSSEARAQVMEELSSMAMTAATERQSLIESLILQIMKAAMNHSSLSKQRAQPISSYHVCQVCGFIAKDTPPERCPVCRAHAAQFDVVR